MDVAFAYRHCERVTRAEARNFSYGIRLLPGPKRRALSAVYALARRIDDIGDDEAVDAGLRLDRLQRVRGRLASMDGERDDPVLVALADSAGRYPVPVGAFEELIDGCVADVRGTTYTTFDELVGYCRCVAGSVGRLSLGVFGAADPAAASPVADALGIALQLTNILRDIAEDRATGRVYLPAEDLARFGVEPADMAADLPAFTELVRLQVERARRYYDEGFGLLPMLDRRSAACTAAMAGIYRRLLDRIAADPPAVLDRRMSLPGREKAVIAARSLIGTAA
jgi:15-cis-phytoene synthase